VLVFGASIVVSMCSKVVLLVLFGLSRLMMLGDRVSERLLMVCVESNVFMRCLVIMFVLVVVVVM